jgi:transcriptional regulator with XRE-family HTH domain
MQGSLARRLRVLRAERGLTLRDAAEHVGIRAATLSDIEHGHTRPHDVTLAKIAKSYGVPLDELLEEPVSTGKGSAPPSEASAGISEVSDIEELGRMARDLKAEWSRLAAYDRVVDLSREEYLETMRRLEEIEGTILAARDRAQALKKKLDEYEAEGVFELAAG